MVKPILKKLSHSEKSSLDLDRGWDEQDERYRSSGPLFYESGTMRTGSSKDISFAGYGEPVRYHHHARSASGHSHASITTAGSGSGLGIGVGGVPMGGPRSGSTFVHPFQQTPRSATPPQPMSYADSLASVADRDHSPTINEDDDNYDAFDTTKSGLHIDNGPGQSNNSVANSVTHSSNSNSSSNSSSNHRYTHNPPLPPTSHPTPIPASYSHSQPSLAGAGGRPTHISRASSFNESPNPYTTPARASVGIRSRSTTPAQSSRLVHVSSQSDLHQDYEQHQHHHLLHRRHSKREKRDPPKPIYTNVRVPTHRSAASPSSPVGSMSPFSRSSFEAAAFPRLRAKSDLDTATRAEHVREARRKIQAKELAKEEKYARAEIRQRERADNKRALEAEKRAATLRKEREAARRREEMAALAEAMPPNSKHARKISGTSGGRPSFSRLHRSSESSQFIGGYYDAMESSNPPSFGNEAGGARHVSFQSYKRTNTAKRKTHGAWTAFVLWLRTRLLRLNG